MLVSIWLASSLALSQPAAITVPQYTPPADLQQRVARSAELSANRFSLADENGDGRLDLAEYAVGEWLPFADYDHGRDGGIDQEEFLDKQCGGYGADGAGAPPERQWCRNSARSQFRRMSRGRGLITPASLAGQTRDRFRFNDLNHDGFVTRNEELAAARAAAGH